MSRSQVDYVCRVLTSPHFGRFLQTRVTRQNALNFEREIEVRCHADICFAIAWLLQGSPLDRLSIFEAVAKLAVLVDSHLGIKKIEPEKVAKVKSFLVSKEGRAWCKSPASAHTHLLMNTSTVLVPATRK